MAKRVLGLPKQPDEALAALVKALSIPYNGGMEGATMTKHYGPGPHDTGTTQQEAHGEGVSGPEKSEEPKPETRSEYQARIYNLPELPEGQRWILRDNLAKVTQEVGRLGRKADKLGLEPFAIKVLDREHVYEKTVVDPETGLDETTIHVWDAVEITGQQPQIPGFRFLAKLQHIINEDGSYTNIIRRNQSIEEGDIPPKFRDAGPNCDLCQRNIYRTGTFLVENIETGEIVQLGSEDVKTYTGHEDPLAYAELVSWWAGLEDYSNPESEYMGPREKPYYSTENYLKHVAGVVRNMGYVTRRLERENPQFEGMATSMLALDWMRSKNSYAKESKWGQPTEEDEQLATDALTWVRGLAEDPDHDMSDFDWNMTTAVANQYLPEGTFGIAAYAVEAYRRHLGYEYERSERKVQAAKSEWVGEVKERRVFELTVEATGETQGDYGTTWRYNMRDDDGNAFLWWASRPMRSSPTAPDSITDQGERQYWESINEKAAIPGTRVRLKATVKEHGEFRDEKQTVITRGKVEEMELPETIDASTA